MAKTGQRAFARRGGKSNRAKKPVKLEPREQLIAKKAFHHLKTIRKEIKKAKEFEVRKILRRIKQAQEQHSKAEGDDKAGLQKLEAQLAFAKVANVELLAAQAAQAIDLPLGFQQQQQPQERSGGQAQPVSAAEQAAATAGGVPHTRQQARAVVEARILAAKAVRQRLAEVQQELKRVEEAAARREAAAAGKAEGASQAAGAAQGSPAATQPRDRSQKRALEQQQQADGAEPLDNMAAGALAKLRKSRGDGPEGSSGDSDSGVMDGVGGSEGSEGGPGGAGSLDDDSGADVQQPERPPKPGQRKPDKRKDSKKLKNRLGQRARRRLAEMQFGGSAKHLRHQQQDGQQPAQRQQQQLDGDVPSLHPSWAAKQAAKHKLKLSIAGGSTQSKKVVFGDHDSEPIPVHQGGTPASQFENGGVHKQRQKHTPSAAEPLHPSWEARKRLQEQQRHLPPSTGKKTVFTDDD